MSDHERYEPKTRGESKEEHGPLPSFPDPGEHTLDLIDACNTLGTIVALIDRGQVFQARSYAHDAEGTMQERIFSMEVDKGGAES